MTTALGALHAKKISNFATTLQRLQHFTVRDCNGDGRVRHPAYIHDGDPRPPWSQRRPGQGIASNLDARRASGRCDEGIDPARWKVYFGSDRINVINLPAKIQDHLKDREAERKVYIVADMRARWSNVKMVLDGVRSAGILRVAFLVS